MMTVCGKLPIFAIIAKLKQNNSEEHQLMGEGDLGTYWHNGPVQQLIQNNLSINKFLATCCCLHIAASLVYVPRISCCQCASWNHAHPTWVQHRTKHRWWIRFWDRRWRDIKWTLVRELIREHSDRRTGQARGVMVASRNKPTSSGISRLSVCRGEYGTEGSEKNPDDREKQWREGRKKKI